MGQLLVAEGFSKIDDIKDDTSKTVTRYSRKITYFKEDSSRTITGFFYNLWKRVGNAGLGFLNVIPKLGQTYYSFFSNFYVNNKDFWPSNWINIS